MFITGFARGYIADFLVLTLPERAPVREGAVGVNPRVGIHLVRVKQDLTGGAGDRSYKRCTKRTEKVQSQRQINNYWSLE